MKNTVKGYVIGFLCAVILMNCIGFAANTTTLYDVITNGVRIVIDGQKLNPTDANGNPVEPIIYNGTTYLPVRAVANALGKAVYWDGPSYTVYLGNMNGTLEYPTLTLADAQNIGDGYSKLDSFTDNYGNHYTSALRESYNGWYPENSIGEYLLNYKYSRFRGYICVENGENTSPNLIVKLIADGREIWTSPAITKTSRPVPIDVDITGCNHFEIQTSYSGDGTWSTSNYIYLADCGFYQ